MTDALDEDKLQSLFAEWEADNPGATDVDTPPETPMVPPEMDFYAPAPDAPTRLRPDGPESKGGAGVIAHDRPRPEDGLATRVPPPSSPAKSADPDWAELAQRLKIGNLSRASSQAYEGMFANAGNTGAYRPNPHAGEVGPALVRGDIDVLNAKQGHEQRALAMEGQKKAQGVKAAMDDPNSLQSQKAREAIKTFFGEQPLPRGFDGWSASDVQQFANSGTLAKIADDRRAVESARAKTQGAADKALASEAELQQMRKTWAPEFKKAGVDPATATKFDLERVMQMRGQDTTAAALRHREGEDEKKKTEDVPPDYEIAPNANPGADSRKRFTALVASQQKMKELTAAMREELKGADLADRMLPGEKKRRLQQLATQMRIEAKNVAELGALSGPDMGLIESIATDPTSLQSLAGGSLDANLAGLDSWADSSVRAGEKAYGLRHSGGGVGVKTRNIKGGGTAYQGGNGKWYTTEAEARAH